MKFLIKLISLFTLLTLSITPSAFSLWLITNNSGYPLTFNTTDINGKFVSNNSSSITLTSGSKAYYDDGGGVQSSDDAINVVTADNSFPFPYNKAGFGLGRLTLVTDSGAPYCEYIQFGLEVILTGTQVLGDAPTAGQCSPQGAAGGVGYSYAANADPTNQALLNAVITAA